MRLLPAVLAALTVFCAAAEAQEKASAPFVSVVNWSDDIDPAVLDEFTAETGVRVVYDTYDTSDTLQAKLLAGKTGYDVVISSAALLQRDIRFGLYQKLDHARLPHAGDLLPAITARLAEADPGNQYAVNYLWFTAGFAYNEAKAAERLGGAKAPSAFATWDALFKPDLLRRFADCGVTLFDDPQPQTQLALAYLKLDPRSRRPADLTRASELLAYIRPLLKKEAVPEIAGALAKSQICLAVTWAGEAQQAAQRARQADGVRIGYAVPHDAVPIGLDNMAIPKDAPHPDLAYRFIDFLLRPEIAARNSEATHFASGVAGAKALLPGALAEDTTVYPDAEAMQHLFLLAGFDSHLLPGQVKPAPPTAAKPGTTPRPKREKRRPKSGLLGR